MIPIYAQRIREVRQKAGLTQTEFALAIGTTKNQLSKYELGTQDTPTKIIIAVCEKYNVDANWLMGIKDAGTIPLDDCSIPGKVINTWDGKKIPTAVKVVETGFDK